MFGEFVVALWAAVPEAAHDEDGDFAGGEGDVGANTSTTPAFGHPSYPGGESNRAMKAISAVAGVPEELAEEEFGRGVFGSVGAHDAGDGFGLGCW